MSGSNPSIGICVSGAHAQLEAIRASARAQIAMVDALLALLSPPAPIAGGCQHEHRIAAGRMGAPDAWACADCSAGGDGPDESGGRE